jgi:hypothetical protein
MMTNMKTGMIGIRLRILTGGFAFEIRLGPSFFKRQSDSDD